FIFKSLWLDECITAWVISGNFYDAVSRSITYQGQSPLYFVLLWIWRALAGSSELALRLPSIGAIAVAALGVYKLARRFAAPAPAAAGVTIFLSSTFVLHAMSARPYA